MRVLQRLPGSAAAWPCWAWRAAVCDVVEPPAMCASLLASAWCATLLPHVLRRRAVFNSSPFKLRLRKVDGSVLVSERLALLLNSHPLPPAKWWQMRCGSSALLAVGQLLAGCFHSMFACPTAAPAALLQQQLEGDADWLEVMALASKHGYEELFKKCTDFMRVGRAGGWLAIRCTWSAKRLLQCGLLFSLAAVHQLIVHGHMRPRANLVRHTPRHAPRPLPIDCRPQVASKLPATAAEALACFIQGAQQLKELRQASWGGDVGPAIVFLWGKSSL